MAGTGARIPTEDLRLGQIALHRGYLDPDQLKACLAAQEELLQSGQSIRLGQLLIQHDLISTSQLVELLETQKLLRRTTSRFQRPKDSG